MKKKSVVSWILEFVSLHKFYFIVSLVFAFLSVLCGFFPYFFVGNIINQLLQGNRDWNFYVLQSIWIGLAWIAHWGFHGISTLLSHTATFKILAEMRYRLTEKLAKLPLGTVLSQSSGTYKNIIVERVDATEVTLAHLIPEFTSGLFGPFIILIAMLVIDWRLTMLSLLTIPIVILAYGNMLRKSEGDFENTVEKTKKLNDTAVEYINGIEVIKVFGKEKFSYDKFVKAAKEGADCFIEWMRKCVVEMGIVTAFLPSGLLFLLPFGTLFYLQGSLTASNFILLIILSLSLLTPFILVASYMDDLRKIATIFGEVIAILEKIDLPRPTELTDIPKGTELRMTDVSFGYSDKEEVLHSISLTIEPDTVTALVGPSGSGKSTIAKLLASFWDVNSGSITFGGVDIQNLPLDYYSRQIAYVTQDNYLFDETIMENIRMGNSAASDEEVIDIARKCGCYDFISNLENGFETRVGTGGNHLSGGERQRIAIARAMLKNALVIILDEATAYTDPENEALIQSSLARLIEGRTLLVIAHRLSTIASADQIVVVNDGRIEAKGKHVDLQKTCPLYASMWQAHIAVKDSDKMTEGGLADA
ncbi:ABC transporter ATP-binding protein [Streptococcus sp. HF-100]|uniref:ABC transporter ATP-binding protein n=1 Tax=Streptococcus sp. HF-100 TaxID=2785791 RepID=UPI00189E0538|nr:ABC transporter ATP-binding protein [Streptococcus sp. HF-100]MBF7075672.1 ABC transporter ATP-binding protein [Streptococcus sp. HF-100]